MADRQLVGRQGEDLAAAHVEGLGWTVVARNWRCREGELDLVALEPGGTLVVCEVKCRSGLGYGDPLESITWAKLARLRVLAARYLNAHPHRGPVRLDGIGILTRRGMAPVITHRQGIAS